jgi:hypothetical protein
VSASKLSKIACINSESSDKDRKGYICNRNMTIVACLDITAVVRSLRTVGGSDFVTFPRIIGLPLGCNSMSFKSSRN